MLIKLDTQLTSQIEKLNLKEYWSYLFKHCKIHFKKIIETDAVDDFEDANFSIICMNTKYQTIHNGFEIILTVF